MDIHQCYSEINHWLGDLDFLEIERRFLKRIIKEYIASCGLLSINVIKEQEERLTQLGAESHLLRKDMVICRSRIELVIKNIISMKATEICQNAESYKTRLDLLSAEFYYFKNELYLLVSKVLQLEAND